MSKARTVAVGMSGGVDSSAAAALLVEQGYKVIGLTALMTGEHSRCCSPEDVERAKVVAGQLGIEHHTIDLHADFDAQVIRPFMRDYLAGRTPSPCVLCNRLIKFGRLLEEAAALGAERVATGHFARLDTMLWAMARFFIIIFRLPSRAGPNRRSRWSMAPRKTTI